MWIVIAYIAFLAYAAGLFVYAVTHNRPWAAIGILVSVSGLQFALMRTLDPNVSFVLAVSGLIMVGRDIATAMLPRIAPALIRGRSR